MMNSKKSSAGSAQREMRSVYKVLVGKLIGKMHLEHPSTSLPQQDWESSDLWNLILRLRIVSVTSK
jgi:hypothetical protein